MLPTRGPPTSIASLSGGAADLDDRPIYMLAIAEGGTGVLGQVCPIAGK